MSNINFPSSPTTGQTYTFNDAMWTFNGIAWLLNGSIGPQGTQGHQGPQGFQGNQGHQGPKGDQGFQGNSGISAGATYYFNQSQSSDVSPYKVLTTQPNGVQQTVVVNMPGSQQDVLVQQFITPQLGFAVIPGGTQRFHLHYLKQASNDSIEAYVTIQLTDSIGNPIAGTLFQTGVELVDWIDASTPHELNADLTLPTTGIDPTNRMIVKLYLNNNDSNAHTVTWYTEGTQYYSFVVTTVGVIGNQGATGPQGFQGHQGPQGFQGHQGPQGFQGNQGFQGHQGPQGYQGPQGHQGPQGYQGPQGHQGPKGDQGFQGHQGPKGDQGFQGHQGPKGDQGFQGHQGPKGDQGFQGHQGPQGFQGSTATLSPSSYVVKAVKGDSSPQTILNNGNNQVVTFVVEFDPQNWWTPSKFKPTIPGYYNIQIAVWWNPATSASGQNNIQLRLNGGTNGGTQVAIQQTPLMTENGYGQEIDIIMPFNGSTDYVEVTAFTGNPTSQTIHGESSGTWFAASLLTNGVGPQGPAGSLAAGTTTGTVTTFTSDRVYGTLASPETGNISVNTLGGLLGVTNIIIHNSGTAPTFTSEFKRLSGSGIYQVSQVNYIYCTFITSTEIIYSINQRS